MDSATESVFQECTSVEKDCGIFDHPNRGVIEVRGRDRTSFLHNVLSNDIKNLAPGTGISACLLNTQAKIIANLNVLCFNDHLWLTCDYILKNKVLEHLNKLIVMEEVQILDRSDELKLISIHGPKATTLLRRVLNQPSVPDTLLSYMAKTVDGADTFIVRVNMTGETGFAFLVPKEKTSLIRAAIDRNSALVSLVQLHTPTLETMRITAGIPRYGVDFDESHNPLEARLEHTVSFTKGCFPGQEILARLNARGGVSKKLCGVVLKGEIIPKKNDRITKGGKEVGHITSATFSPTLKKTIALGYLKKGYWPIGRLLAVETREAHLSARVEPLPF